MIRVQNVAKSYEGKPALRGLSLSVDKGEIVALTGLKGAGKTTAMDVIAGVREADGGTVEIGGVAMDSEISRARQLVGYVPAETPAPRDMSPRAYLKFLADARGLSSRDAAGKIDAAIKLLGLQDAADKSMRRLNRAALRLASIAQAVFFEPEALLIDEPTAGLDPKEIAAVRGALKEVARERAVLLASESLTEMCALANRVIVLSEGRVVSEGTPDQLHNMTRLSDSVRVVTRADEAAARAAFSAVKDATVKSAKVTGEGLELTIQMNGDQREALFSAAMKANLPLLELSPVRKPLDKLLESLVSEQVEGGVDEA
ncbi:MAG: ABC transporter ATP-binding protein [Clostridia bacterium]|nr:ABC transporter ATP-binding protein [Clostridia bacterium]